MKQRTRIITYSIVLIIIIIFGLSSRRYGEFFPVFFATYGGDTFWAMAIYFALRLFLNLSYLKSIVISAIFSLLIEISQLYQADWFNSLRNTIIGALILGFGFKWSDLLCYATGIILAFVIDIFIVKLFVK